MFGFFNFLWVMDSRITTCCVKYYLILFVLNVPTVGSPGEENCLILIVYDLVRVFVFD